MIPKFSLSCCKKSIGFIKRNNIQNHDDFYNWNCLHAFSTKSKLESHEKLCKKKAVCGIGWPKIILTKIIY